jgi:hypothetical protein
MKLESRDGRLRDTIPLPNGLVAEVWDHTQPIAEDTFRVCVNVRIAVPLEASLFDDPDAFATTRSVFGTQVVSIYANERSFVTRELREQVFSELVALIERHVLTYVSHANFPTRFARFHHAEILKHPYRYAPHRDDTEQA